MLLVQLVLALRYYITNYIFPVHAVIVLHQSWWLIIVFFCSSAVRW